MKAALSFRTTAVCTGAWAVLVIGLVLHERYVTIGNIDGPWALYGHYKHLVFYNVQTSASAFSLRLRQQLVFTTLAIPPALMWLSALFFIPAGRWMANTRKA